MQRLFNIDTLGQTELAGKDIALTVGIPACVYLSGSMGAGKTTLAKTIVAALGYQGAVTSPTYNLIQEYSVNDGTVYHMDLYRLDDPAELQYLAIEDLWGANSLFLIEWAEKGEGLITPATHYITIERSGGSASARTVTLRTA